MTKNKKKLTVDEVVNNLLTLISPLQDLRSNPSTPFVATEESLIGKCMFLSFN